jgi:hypothetical protein
MERVRRDLVMNGGVESLSRSAQTAELETRLAGSSRSSLSGQHSQWQIQPQPALNPREARSTPNAAAAAALATQDGGLLNIFQPDAARGTDRRGWGFLAGVRLFF